MVLQTAASLVWTHDLVERITSLLEPNERACLRLVSRATALQLANWTTIRLSQPVPRWAFRQRWAAPRSCRDLSYEKCVELVALTASSNDVANLELALAATDTQISWRSCLAAVEAGALASCGYLAQRVKGKWNWAEAGEAAAKAGREAVVAWILACCPALKRDLVAWEAANGAARGGHVGLMDQMVAQAQAARAAAKEARLAARERAEARAAAWVEPRAGVQQQEDEEVEPSSDASSVPDEEDSAGEAGGEWEVETEDMEEALQAWQARASMPYDHGHHGRRLFLAALAGCDVDTVVRLVCSNMGGAFFMNMWPEPEVGAALAAAVLGTHPGWAANAELVLKANPLPVGTGCLRDAWLLGQVADIVPRLQWLQAHDLLDLSHPLVVLEAVVCGGDLAGLKWLLAAGAGVSVEEEEKWALSQHAARKGHVDVLRAMKQAHWQLKPGDLLETAAGEGHVPVMAWLWETFPGLALADLVFCAACSSGSMEAVLWVRQRLQAAGPQVQGLPPGAWADAAVAGCEAVVELLAELGAPMPMDGEPYLEVARAERHLWRMFPLLKRLGVPFAPPQAGLFSDCVMIGAPHATLEWLLAEGCPVANWADVESVVILRRCCGDVAATLRWVRQQRAQRKRPSKRARWRQRRRARGPPLPLQTPGSGASTDPSGPQCSKRGRTAAAAPDCTAPALDPKLDRQSDASTRAAEDAADDAAGPSTSAPRQRLFSPQGAAALQSPAAAPSADAALGPLSEVQLDRLMGAVLSPRRPASASTAAPLPAGYADAVRDYVANAESAPQAALCPAFVQALTRLFATIHRNRSMTSAEAADPRPLVQSFCDGVFRQVNGRLSTPRAARQTRAGRGGAS